MRLKQEWLYRHRRVELRFCRSRRLQLAVWLVGWLVGWLISWLVGQLVSWLVGWLL